MKIVHMTSVHKTFDIRIFYKECRTLSEQGNEIVLISTNAKNEVVNGIRIISIPMAKNRLSRMILTTLKILIAALNEQADIYHAHDPELLPCLQILRLYGKKTIYDMHENLPKQLLTKEWLMPQLRKPISLGFRIIERLLMKDLNIIFAESSYLEDYKWVTSYRIVQNMPIVDEIIKVTRNKNVKPSIGYIGVVSEERGSWVTVKALNVLARHGYDIAWDCVGDVSDDHQSELVLYCNTNNIRANFYGYKTPIEGWEIISKCHIGLAVLSATPNHIRSYPTKMFEYMAMALPVVVSDIQLYKAIIDEIKCGIYVDPDKPDELSKAIKWILDNPHEAQLMGDNGKNAVVQKYNWSVQAKELLSFYKVIYKEHSCSEKK